MSLNTSEYRLKEAKIGKNRGDSRHHSKIRGMCANSSNVQLPQKIHP